MGCWHFKSLECSYKENCEQTNVGMLGEQHTATISYLPVVVLSVVFPSPKRYMDSHCQYILIFMYLNNGVIFFMSYPNQHNLSCKLCKTTLMNFILVVTLGIALPRWQNTLDVATIALKSFFFPPVSVISLCLPPFHCSLQEAPQPVIFLYPSLSYAPPSHTASCVTCFLTTSVTNWPSSRSAACHRSPQASFCTLGNISFCQYGKKPCLRL